MNAVAHPAFPFGSTAKIVTEPYGANKDWGFVHLSVVTVIDPASEGLTGEPNTIYVEDARGMLGLFEPNELEPIPS